MPYNIGEKSTCNKLFKIRSLCLWTFKAEKLFRNKHDWVNDSIEKFEKSIENLFHAFPVLKGARKSFGNLCYNS